MEIEGIHLTGLVLPRRYSGDMDNMLIVYMSVRDKDEEARKCVISQIQRLRNYS